MNDEPILYARLFEIAAAMRTWIYMNSFDDQEIFDELGITGEELETLEMYEAEE